VIHRNFADHRCSDLLHDALNAYAISWIEAAPRNLTRRGF